MILHYVSSNGNSYDLKVGHLRMRTADFQTYEWLPQAVAQQYGEKPYRFDREARTYAAELSVFGTMEEKRTYLNLLHAAFDHDIINMTPGKIVHGEYEIECYITMSNTYYEAPFIYNSLSIYCPYPFWKKENVYELRGGADAKVYEYLDYTFGYPYDFKAKLPGYEMIANRSEAVAPYKLIIYGPTTNPVISIDGVQIGVYAVIGAAERVEISSVEKTVILKGAVDKNLFNERIKGASMFEGIKSGEHSVLWSGSFDADLVLYEERSEPLWI